MARGHPLRRVVLGSKPDLDEEDLPAESPAFPSMPRGSVQSSGPLLQNWADLTRQMGLAATDRGQCGCQTVNQ